MQRTWRCSEHGEAKSVAEDVGGNAATNLRQVILPTHVQNHLRQKARQSTAKQGGGQRYTPLPHAAQVLKSAQKYNFANDPKQKEKTLAIYTIGRP